MAKYKEYGYDIQNGKAIIPEWETEIKKGAFMGCKELTSVEFPLWIKKIGEDAFCGCSNLTSISIPPSVTKIGGSAFSGCSSLTSIAVSKDNKVYDSREDCNAIIRTESNTLIRGCEKTTIPPSVTKIGEHAFWSCSTLTSITIPLSVTEIGNGAFRDCSSLTSISIPPSVTCIGWNAFSGCSSLTSITIPESVREIKCLYFAGTFSRCSSLTEVRIPYYCDVDEFAFLNSPKAKIIRYDPISLIIKRT